MCRWPPQMVSMDVIKNITFLSLTSWLEDLSPSYIKQQGTKEGLNIIQLTSIFLSDSSLKNSWIGDLPFVIHHL